MGSRRKFPDTSQLGFFPESEESSSSNKKSGCPVDRFVQGNPEEIFIGETSLRAYLSDSGKSWVIRFREILYQQEIAPFLKAYKSTGRKPYHPFVILGLILYGIQQGRWSLRDLEDLARFDVCAWWICGGQQPDHSTIGDFLHLHRDLLTEDFFVTLTADLVKRLRLTSSTVAGDGTVVEALSSRASMLKQEAAAQALEKAKKKFGEDSLEAKQSETVLETVKARNQERKRKGRAKQEARVSPDEPEAVVQPRKDGVYRPGYKPSILSDENRLILGQYVDPSNEMACVSPMLEQYYDLFGGLPERSLWDGNYNKFELLKLSVSLNFDCLCNVEPSKSEKAGGKFIKSNFDYDEKEDVYICPAGQILRYRESGTMNGLPYRRYQCRDYKDCPDRKRCARGKTGRTITRFAGDELKEAMRVVMSHPTTKNLIRFRKAMVEPVFGDVKHRQGLGRFHRRGLNNVRVEFSLHCISYNLRRAIRLEQASKACFIAFQASETAFSALWAVWAVNRSIGTGFFMVARVKIEWS